MGKLPFDDDSISLGNLRAAVDNGSPVVVAADFDPQGNISTTPYPNDDNSNEVLFGTGAFLFWIFVFGCVIYAFKSMLLRFTRWLEKKLCCGGQCSEGTCCVVCCFAADLENTDNVVELEEGQLDDIWSTRMDLPPPYEEAINMPRPEQTGTHTADDDSEESGFEEPELRRPRGYVNVVMDIDVQSEDSQSTNTTAADEESLHIITDDEYIVDGNEGNAHRHNDSDADDEDEEEYSAEEENIDAEAVAYLQEQLRNNLHTIVEEPHGGTGHQDYSYPPSPIRMSRAPSQISLGRDFTYPNTPYPSFPPTPNMLSRNPSMLSINDLPDTVGDTVSFRSIDSQLPTYRSAVNVIMIDQDGTN